LHPPQIGSLDWGALALGPDQEIRPIQNVRKLPENPVPGPIRSKRDQLQIAPDPQVLKSIIQNDHDSSLQGRLSESRVIGHHARPNLVPENLSTIGSDANPSTGNELAQKHRLIPPLGH
jgi:hypothetical protein